LTIILTLNTHKRLLSAPHRILAARCEQKTCVAHQYSIVKDHPEKLRNQPPFSSGSFLLSSSLRYGFAVQMLRWRASQRRSSFKLGGPG